jgi:hypothetical protein
VKECRQKSTEVTVSDEGKVLTRRLRRSFVSLLATALLSIATAVSTPQVFPISYLGFASGIAAAAEKPSTQFTQFVSLEEFKSLAEDLAPKVSLFADVWAQDPGAEFYGGTTRDYLYWILDQFKGVRNREQALRIIEELKAKPLIDIKEFIIGESDVDVTTGRHSLSLNADDYHVRKLDFIGFERFDPNTPAGRNELNQGYVPVEKIRLGKSGFIHWNGVGDGLREIYSGNLTVHFAPPQVFENTHFAKLKLNHPILLALRYLRQIGTDYFHRYGPTYPDKEVLFNIDPESKKAVQTVIEKAKSPHELDPYLSQPQFKNWINATISKAFSSYTNPTAAKLLLDEFGVSELPTLYSGIQAYNQYVFSVHRDRRQIDKKLEEYHVDSSKFFQNPKEVFPNLEFYHGTRTDSAYRSILFQGVLASSSGSAGSGLYGVAQENLDFASRWAHGSERVVKFDVDANAKVVDVTKGEGARVFSAYRAAHPDSKYLSSRLTAEKTFDEFARDFGVDILKYPYGGVDAFVVKNSAALHNPGGYQRKLMNTSKLIEKSETVQDIHGFEDFLKVLKANHVSERELQMVFRHLSVKSAHGEVFETAQEVAAWLAGAPPQGSGSHLFWDKVAPYLSGYNDKFDQLLAGSLLPRLAQSDPARFNQAFAIAEEYSPDMLAKHFYRAILNRDGEFSSLKLPLTEKNILKFLEFAERHSNEYTGPRTLNILKTLSSRVTDADLGTRIKAFTEVFENDKLSKNGSQLKKAVDAVGSSELWDYLVEVATDKRVRFGEGHGGASSMRLTARSISYIAKLNGKKRVESTQSGSKCVGVIKSLLQKLIGK